MDEYASSKIRHSRIMNSGVVYAKGGQENKLKKEDQAITLQINVRAANRENNLHQRYPSVQFNRIGLLNPNKALNE